MILMTWLKHRCYQHIIRGSITYEEDYRGLWGKIIVHSSYFELLRSIRNQFERIHNIPVFSDEDFHLTFLRGSHFLEADLAEKKIYDSLEVEILITSDFFWRDSFLWVNAFCSKTDDLKKIFLPESLIQDSVSWGHITLGRISSPIPDFVTYSDLDFWKTSPNS